MTARLPSALLAGSPWRVRACALLLAGLCALALAGFASGLMRNLEDRVGDVLWRVGPASAPADAEERRFVVVDIDEASVSKLGPWPWPRARLAELSRRLAALGAGLQVFDVVFSEPRPDDAAFLAELARQPAVLAQIFSLDASAPAAVGMLHGALNAGAPACGQPFPQAAGYIANAPAFAAVPGLAVGHITPRIASDGAVRHLPAVICYEGRAYPVLGLAALLKATSSEPGLSLVAGRNWLDPAWRLTHPALPGIAVPLDENGEVRLSYRLPRRAFVSVSAADVLAGKVPAELFRGAWVLIGATAFGIGDAVPTPHGGAVGGVEVHAHFITGLLDGHLPYAPRSAAFLALGLAMVAGAALLLVTRWRGLPALGLPVAGVLLAAALLALHTWLLASRDLWLGWADPAAFSLIAGVLLAAGEYARTRFERERLYSNLASYLPAPVAAEIAFHEPTGMIDAQRREITVMFADLRNYSAYCEGRRPEEAAALLHAFFTSATRIVEGHGGMVEEFIGDAIMAVWNAPRECPDHAARALAAAHQLQAEITPLFSQPAPGLEPLALGIGIESGSALVGSFGPAHRRTHTALGETVTIASRLQAMTADLAQPILLGEGAAARLPADTVISLGSFLLEGLRSAHLVYAPPPGRRMDSVLIRPRFAWRRHRVQDSR